jgi:hypothetical protein
VAAVPLVLEPTAAERVALALGKHRLRPLRVRSFVLDPRPGAQTHIGLGHLDKDRMVGALLQPVDAGATGLNGKQRHQAELSSSPFHCCR